MKLKLILMAVLTASTIQAEDMQKYLGDTQDMAKEGKYQEALERHIWFHDHALEHERAMHGVRLSFALSYWKELGKQYPPALEAMKQTRDEKTALLMEGKGSYDLFVDVNALNRTLVEGDKTVALFRRLDETQPDLAKRCWNVADDAVIAAKAYDLARKHIGNPVREYVKVKASYEHQTSLYDNPQIGGDRFRAYNENSFVEECLKLIEVALALDDQEAAKEIQTQALTVLDDYRLQDAIPKNGDEQDAQSAD